MAKKPKDADKKEKESIKQFNSRKEVYNSTFGGKCYNPDGEYASRKAKITREDVVRELKPIFGERDNEEMDNCIRVIKNTDAQIVLG